MIPDSKDESEDAEEAHYMFTQEEDEEPADEFCLHVSEAEPLSYEDTMHRPDAEMWRKAMEEEIAAHHSNGTWKVEALPPGKRAIGCKWVFCLKRKADGSIERYKARLIAKGFSQRPGFKYTEIFAPTIHMSSI